MPKPEFIYHPTTPPGEEPTRFQVYSKRSADIDDAYLGTVYLTAGGEWVADWSTRNGAPNIAMPGFGSKASAAEALYWFAPPAQSLRSRPAGKQLGGVDERPVDMSRCGCCVNNDCECEGLNRISQRVGTAQSYEICPSLIPETGVLVSLMPFRDSSDFLVDFNTRGIGTGIGYLQHRDDGRYDVRVGQKSIGTAATPEVGMWACFQAHTATKSFAQLLEHFEPHQEEPAGTE
ncbi:hypothetical protein [Streptomyces sp. NPDC056061]|uniref:hypothetical protein n=1 Tax=Streptomyces sp. NPDC056061 TaxID=3345700 RepID=UPI0035D5E0F7